MVNLSGQIARRGSTSGETQPSMFARIYEITRQIPEGSVATYGQIALVAGIPSARIVGRAMAKLPAGNDVPWHRVVNSQGQISARRDGGSSPEQRKRLKTEGVHFDNKGRLDFRQVGWTGPSWAWLAAMGYDVEALVFRSQNQPRRGAWSRWDL